MKEIKVDRILTTVLTLATFFFGFNALIYPAVPQKMHKKIEKAIEKIIPGPLDVSHQLIALAPEIKNTIQKKIKSSIPDDPIDLWIIRKIDNGLLYALVNQAVGRTLPFTYLVVFDSRASVVAVRIIQYREEYGREITSRKWLNQFGNKNLATSAPEEHNIDSISGATISSRSLINGVEKLSYVMFYWLKSKRDGEV